jgi:hypothetical protein
VVQGRHRLFRVSIKQNLAQLTSAESLCLLEIQAKVRTNFLRKVETRIAFLRAIQSLARILRRRVLTKIFFTPKFGLFLHHLGKTSSTQERKKSKGNEKVTKRYRKGNEKGTKSEGKGKEKER